MSYYDILKQVIYPQFLFNTGSPDTPLCLCVLFYLQTFFNSQLSVCIHNHIFKSHRLDIHWVMPRPLKNNQQFWKPENRWYYWTFGTSEFLGKMAYLQPHKNNLTPFCTIFNKIHNRTSCFRTRKTPPEPCSAQEVFDIIRELF